jgi:hypothetical protein
LWGSNSQLNFGSTTIAPSTDGTQLILNSHVQNVDYFTDIMWQNPSNPSAGGAVPSTLLSNIAAGTTIDSYAISTLQGFFGGQVRNGNGYFRIPFTVRVWASEQNL